MPRASHKARPIYAADFEATTDPEDCRVWAFGIADITDPKVVRVGRSIGDFFDLVKAKDSIVYFHNLRYDGGFILWELLTREFRHVNGEWSLQANEFSSLISDSGQFYSIRVKWSNGVLTEFRDSFKKIPLSLAEMASAYNLDIAKGEIDYDAPRPVGYAPTAEEWAYMRTDVSILATVLGVMYSEGMKSLTVGSDALKEYKSLTKGFRALFPVLADDVDTAIRRGYKGGWTFASPRFTHKMQGCGNVYDVNSLYPSVMYNELLPYGVPEYVHGEVVPTEDYPLVLQTVTFTAKLKKNHVPCIQIKNHSMFHATEYLTKIEEPTTLTLTDTDWKVYNEQYDIAVVSYEGGFRFKGAHNLFKDYIGKWAKIKEESTGGLREIAKLFLNSLYGKFATNPIIKGKEPYLDDGQVVRYRTTPTEIREPIYTAIGVWITAYGRAITIRAAQSNYARFAYADTDSLHILGAPITNLDIDPVKLGAWKHEYAFEAAVYLRPKAYMERSGSELVTKISGLPERARKTMGFDDMKSGTKIDGKLKHQSVRGGVVLVPTKFRV